MLYGSKAAIIETADGMLSFLKEELEYDSLTDAEFHLEKLKLDNWTNRTIEEFESQFVT